MSIFFNQTFSKWIIHRTYFGLEITYFVGFTKDISIFAYFAILCLFFKQREKEEMMQMSIF